MARRTSNSSLRAEIRGISSQINGLKGRIANYENAKREIDNTVTKLKSIRNSLNDKSKFSSARASSISGEATDAIVELGASKGSINTQISQLRSQISGLESQIERLEREIRQNELEI